MEVQKFIVMFAIGAYPDSEAFRSHRWYTSLRFMSMSLSNRCVGLSPGLFPSGFVIKVLHKFLSSFVPVSFGHPNNTAAKEILTSFR